MVNGRPMGWYLLVLLFSCSVQGAQWWVSTTGSDTTGNGSAGSPYASLNQALASASPGDEIVVTEGVYEGQVRVRIPDITIRPAVGDAVHLTTPITDDNTTSTVIFDVDADGSCIQDMEISGGYYYGIMFFTRWDWGDPEDRTGASNITIENCRIHDTGRDCIKITPGCDDITIVNCEIHDSGQRDDSNAEGIDCVNGDRVVIRDCWIHDTATTGVYLKGGAMDGLVERTFVERCGSLGIVLGFDTSPEYFDLTVNPSRYENIRGLVRNCIVRDTGYAGIAFYGAKDGVVVNNTIINTAQNGQSAIYFGTPLQDWEPDPDPGDGIGYRAPTINPDVRNNVVLQEVGSGNSMVEIRTFYHDSIGRVNGLSGMPGMDHNIYHVTGSGFARFEDNRPDSTLSDGTLSQWRAHTGDEGNSREQDPMLGVDREPLTGSPCIDQGDSDVPVSVDFRGSIRTPPYDIGALETASASGVRDIRHIAHIARRNYTTVLKLIQPGNREAVVEVTVRNADGHVLDVLSLTAGANQSVEMPLYGPSMPDAAAGEIRILAGAPILRIMYRNNAAGMADFLLTEDTGRRIAFVLAQGDTLTWHGLAMHNVADTPVSVALHAYDAVGTDLGTETIDLPARGQAKGLVGLDGDWFSVVSLSDIHLVVAEVTTTGADLALNGLTISGEGQERLLFTPAVPISAE